MSSNRNIQRDREHTAALLRRIAQGDPTPADVPTWLGHGGEQNCRIDFALLQGSTLSNIEGVTKLRALSHVTHLKEVHGLDIVCTDGIYRFAMQAQH